MKAQGDLFAATTPPAPHVTDDAVALLRARLHATLDLVRAAEDMPWDDHLTIIRQDNAFRYAKDLLPPEEGAALWAEFDVHMDRLYAVMNARLAADPSLPDAPD